MNMTVVNKNLSRNISIAGLFFRSVYISVALAAISATGIADANAAPVDALLTAKPESDAPNGQIEVSLDSMVPVGNDTSSDYHGGHLRVGFSPKPDWWLSGSLWQRSLDTGGDNYQYKSWQLAAQYKFNEVSGIRPALGLRFSAWGDQSPESNSSTPVVVPFLKLNTVSVSNPSDQNIQADVIGTWQLSPSTDFTILLGGGTTQLAYNTLTATTTYAGCKYNLQFTGDTIYGSLAEHCNAPGGVIQQFYVSSSNYGIHANEELAWQGNFVHLGANARWHQGLWKWGVGVLYTQVRRGGVDDILAARGSLAYTQNADVIVQGNYKWTEHLHVIGRLQASSNLFLTDIPVTYNSSTASRFNSTSSLLSLGLVWDF
jgi:hypothetical protein